MPQKFINVGNQSNDGTGDSIREAFSKVNNNFADIYDFLEAPTGFRFANLEDFPQGSNNDFLGYVEDPLLKLGAGGQIVATAPVLIGTVTSVAIVMKNLEAGEGMNIESFGDSFVITNTSSKLSTDPNPVLANDLIGTGLGAKLVEFIDPESTITEVTYVPEFGIYAWRARDFSDPIADQDLVTRQFLYQNFINRDGTDVSGTETSTSTVFGGSIFRENISLVPNTQTVYSTSTNIDKYIVVVNSSGTTSTVDLTLQATSSTHLTRKDYVDTKISLQGTDTIDPATGQVNAGFGTMTGPLLLSRDPITDDDFAPFEGRIAATKAYVDRNDFFSDNNLFITTKGSDYQPLVPPIRRGRAPQYAFATLNKAAQYAEQLIATSRIQVGDYARLITYDNGTPATVYDVTENFYGNNLARLRIDVGTNGSDQIGAAPVGQFKIFPGQYIEGVRSGAIGLIENITKAAVSGDPEVYSIAYVDYADDFNTRITTSIRSGNPNVITMTFEDDQIVPIPQFWVGYKFYTDTGVDNGTVISVGSTVDNAGTYVNSFVVEFPDGTAPGANQRYEGPDWHIYANDFEIGETLVYNTNVSALQITFIIESGEYYEQYPIKLSANTSIRGDEFRRVIIRPATGVSSSPWADTHFRRDAQIDGLQITALNTGTDYSVGGATASPSDSSGVISVTLSTGALTSAVKGYIFQANGGSGVINNVSGGVFTVSLGTPMVDASVIAAGNWKIYEPIEFGRHYLRFPDLPQNNLTTTTNAGGYYNASLELSANKTFVQVETVAWASRQIINNASNTSSVWYNYVLDADLFKNNVGTIIDGLAVDLVQGGSGKIVAGAAELSTVPSLITGQFSLSIERASRVIQSILIGTPITPSIGNTATSVLTELKIEEGADGIVADLLQATSKIVNLDPNFNPAKNNNELDVFLCNDANVIRYVSCQNHGGFMQVLDPDGQIRNKSPYTQTASSFSQSQEKQVFAGGMFVDGFSGNVTATVVDFVTDPLSLEITGLRRRPQVPTFFMHRGVRYEVSFIADFASDYTTTSTNQVVEQFYSATLRLNPLNPGGLANNIIVTDDGGTWAPSTQLPIIIEQPSGIGGLTATGYAVSNGSGNITDIVIEFPGTGYTSTPFISIGGAVFNNLVFANGGITNFNIVTGGSGYTTNTIFEITPVGVLGGVKATGKVATVNASGAITSVTILTNGSGWDASVNYRVTFGDLNITVRAPVAGFIDSDIPDKIELVTAGNRSMLANDFTQVNDLGYGMFVTNGGFMENVSMFTYYNYRSYFALNGAQVRATTGSTVYGEYGLCAIGSDPMEVPIEITLPFALVQLATAYVNNPLFPAQVGQSYIYVLIDPTNGGYPPLNGSIIEINHNGVRKNYAVGSASPALNSSNDVIPNVYQLSFNTGNVASGNDATGLIDVVKNGDTVILRAGSLVKLLGFNPESITRPTTSMIWNDDPTEVYFVTEFSTVQPDGSVLTYTASDYNYITFQTVNQGIVTPTIISGGNNYTTATIVNISTAGLISGAVTSVKGNQGVGTIGIQTIAVQSTTNILPGHTVTGTNILSASYVTYVNSIDKIIGISQPTNGEISSGTVLTFTAVQPVTTLNITSGTITDITVSEGGAGWSVPTTTISVVGIGTGINVLPSIDIAGAVGSTIVKINNLDLISKNRIDAGLAASPVRYYQFALGDQIYEITGYRSSEELNATWSEIDITPPLQETITKGIVLRAGIPLNSKGSLTTKISIMRASGHDFVDVGTGGYATTRIPNDLYGPPLQSPSSTREVIEGNLGRVFYVSTDQDGNFRVGRALTVNQNQGSVNISVPLDLSNLSSVSLRRDLGPPVNEFSIDGTMITEADYKVPTEQAVVTYLNRRLGLDRAGNIYPGAPLGPQFLALSGVLAMKGSLDMANYGIINLSTPRFGFGSDAANKDYTDSKISNAGTAAIDTNNITYRPEWGRMTGSLQLFNDPVRKTATVASTVTSGVSSITFTSLTSLGNYKPGDFLRHRVIGVGIPDGTYVGVVFQDGVTLGLSTIEEVGVFTTTTIPAGTVISFDPIFQAATKRIVDENRQFNRMVDVSLTDVVDKDFVMFSNVVIAANSTTNPPVYTTATQLVNVSNNEFTNPFNTPTSIGGGSDITVTRIANTVTFKLIGGTPNEATNPVTDYHINSYAQIKQSKLLMNPAITAPVAPVGTQTQIQTSLGLAQFDSRMFTATSGWITLVDSTGTTSGVQTTKQAWVPTGGGFLGATNTAADTAATYVSSATMKIWLGNESTDWEFAPNLTPKTDAVQSLGTGAKRWKNLFLSSTATIDGGVVVNTLAKISTNQTTADVFTATVTTGNLFVAGTTVRIGATSGTLTVGNPTVVGTQASQDLYNSVATTLNVGSAATTMRIGATSGTLTVGNTTVVGTGASQDLFNTVATTLNVGSAATTMRIGATSGTLTVGNTTVVGTGATQNLYNTVATTMNFAGAATTADLANAATTLRIGATSGTLTVGNPTVVGTQASQDLFNTVATTLNVGSAATTMRIGATSGTLTVGNTTVVGTGASQNLFNTVATTLNVGSAATTMRIGATSGTLTVGNTTVVGTGASQNLFNTVATTLNFAGAATTLNIGNAGGANLIRGTTTLNVLAADGDGSQVTGAWTLSGGATFQATYADLAEWYGADAEYEPGTVLVFGGDSEVTVTTVNSDSRVAGVVTTNPAYTMNHGQQGTRACIALQGRVPVKVVGIVRKGDMLTTSNTEGYACKAMNPTVGTLIGKALEDKNYPETGIMQVAIGRM